MAKSDYQPGENDHLGRDKRYLTDAGTMQRLLLDKKIHVFYHSMLTEWVCDAPIRADEGRIKVLCDAKRVWADSNGLYTID